MRDASRGTKRTDSGTKSRARCGKRPCHSSRIARCERWRSDARPDGFVSSCRFLLTLKSALQRCAFYFVYRGAAAVPTAALPIYCAAGMHFPALRCAQVTATRPSDTGWHPPVSSVVIGYAPSFSGIHDLSKSHDASTRHARSHEISAPNCWCGSQFGRSADSACEAASHARRACAITTSGSAGRAYLNRHVLFGKGWAREPRYSRRNDDALNVFGVESFQIGPESISEELA
jgi:hypothetical protein